MIEEPSEEADFGESLPSFITPDSAWHTYHVLLEEGVKELEQVQSQRLLEWSRGLMAAAKGRMDSAELVWFASVGLALQDAPYRQSLALEEKRVVEELRSGSRPVASPVGFPLSPLLFRAQSFYTQSSELSDYFAARQWYASVVFRLSDPRETRLAVVLARLIESDPGLLSLWRQLARSGPPGRKVYRPYTNTRPGNDGPATPPAVVAIGIPWLQLRGCVDRSARRTGIRCCRGSERSWPRASCFRLSRCRSNVFVISVKDPG